MEIKKDLVARQECCLPLITPRDDGKNIPNYITIHECELGIEKVDFTAKHYIELLKNPGDRDPRCAYHFLCGDDEMYQFLPTWVRTAHAGSDEGNSSIGIERLVSVNTDFDKAIANQAKLTATLMDMYNIPIKNVVPHKFWSGKECPSRLLAGAYEYTWSRFITMVYDCYYWNNFFSDVDVF